MNTEKGASQLTLQTLSLVVGLMVWSIVSPLTPLISQDVDISLGQTFVILAIPVTLGSALRVSLGYLTNIVGAKRVSFWSFIVLLLPVSSLGQTQSPGMLMLSGFSLGIGGAILSVGVTPVPKYFSRDKIGLVNGIYGVGDIDTAVSSFCAPVLADAISWQNTVRSYLITLSIFAILMFFLGDKSEPKMRIPSVARAKDLSKNYKLCYLSLWYFITFGALVAFGIFLPNFLVDHFSIDKVDAGTRSGIFIALATFLRPAGGVIGDKFNAVQAPIIDFVIMIIGVFILSLSSHIVLFTIGYLAISICAGIGSGLIFKLAPPYLSKEAGPANDIVPVMGGLGGFFPPLVITFVTSITGSSHLAFFFPAIFGVIALIIMIHLNKKEKAIRIQIKIIS